MLEKIKKTVQYTALSIGMIWNYNKSKMLLYVFAVIISPLINIIATIVNKNMINELSLTFESGEVHMTLMLFLLLVAVKGAARLFDTLQSKSFYKMALSADESMLVYTMNKIASMKQIFFDSSQKYDSLKDVIKDDFSMWSLNADLLDILTNAVAIIGTCIIVVPYSGWLTAVVILMAVPLFALNLAKEMYDEKSAKFQRRNDYTVNYYSKLLNSPSAAKEIRLFGICGDILNRWISSIRIQQKITNKINGKKALLDAVIVLFDVLCAGAVMLVCASNVVSGKIQIGDFFLYTSNYALLFTSVADIMSTFRSAIQTSSEYDEFLSFSAISAAERKGIDSIPDEKISIRFENVSFSYNDKMVINDVSFEWSEGETLALIGRNGSGKSTLIKLICGLYECNDGTIYINDTDVKKYSQSVVYSLFGVVYQDFCKYQLKLRETVSAQDMDGINDDDRLWEAFLLAGCDDFRHLMSLGMDTPLGREYDENGVELSGGQWQKIANSRNYFGGRRIQLFDEPASALDPMSEHNLASELLKSKDKCKTSLIISHRLSVGMLADRVLYLEDGRLIEQGTHSELMELNGRYAEMFRLQAEKYS